MANLVPGAAVVWKDRCWILLDILGIERVLVRDPVNGTTELAPAVELKEDMGGAERPESAVAAISKTEWTEAWARFEAIRPLVDRPARKTRVQEVDQIAASLGKDRATIYRWIERWRTAKTVSSLVRSGRSDSGKSRLPVEVEAIVQEQIKSFYLTRERPTPVELWERIAIACRKQNQAAPNLSTIRRRVDSLPDRVVVTKRISSKKARETFEPHRGTFPGAEVPLSVYQIDHSPIDVILVDDRFRQPLGRGYLTIVTDTCTRMLSGFCASLDPPGALSAGLAMAHAILPKSRWLAERMIDASWPIYGVPAKIYADNANEFRGTMLERACAEYGIVIENRPKGLPNYGGHVERLFRTFMKRAQRLQGSTFSSIQERGEYDSEGRAIMTLADFEKWFTYFSTSVYHQRRHRGIGGLPPIKLYEQFILGTANRKGIGLPAPIQNEQKLRLDFMPFMERTIQEYGVVIDNIHYYADVLRPWIHARDNHNGKLKRKFVFARDPRDISEIYFLDPDSRSYHAIPYRDLTHPRMSQWELSAILRRVAERSDLQPDEATIFAGLEEMTRVQEEAAEKTKSARRATQRRENWRAAATSAATPLPEPEQGDWRVGDILPFDEIVEAS